MSFVAFFVFCLLLLFAYVLGYSVGFRNAKLDTLKTIGWLVQRQGEQASGPVPGDELARREPPQPPSPGPVR